MKKLMLISLAVLISASGAFAGWWQTFGGPQRDEGTCVQQTSDGGYIVTGFTWSFGDIGNANMWLIKLDSLGNKEWDKTYGLGWGYSVRQTADGGYIIVGSSLMRMDANGDIIWTRPYAGRCVQQTSDGGYIITGNVWDLMKVSKDGDSLWARDYKKGNASSGFYCIEQTSDGGYILTGSFIDTLDSYVYKACLWLLKTDANGDSLWTKTYGGGDWGIDDYGRCVRETSDGGYIIAGAVHVRGNKRYDLMKTDSQGDSLWFGVPGGNGEAYCVEQTIDGGYIVAGGTEWLTLSSSPAPASGDLMLFKTNANGDSAWVRKYGGDELDAGRYVKQTTDGGYVVVGYTGSYGAGGYDLYLLKTDSVGLLTVKEELGNDHLRNWQVVTPVGREVLVRFADFSNGFEASIFDASGRQVVKLQNHSSSGLLIWGLNSPSGVYFIQVKELNYTSTTKVVLVH